MFKKLKIWLVSIVACTLLACGFAFVPLTASAETIKPTNETVGEIVNSTSEKETLEEILVGSYYYEESVDKGVMFVVKDEINVECVLFLDGAEVATVNATYVADGDIIDVYAMEDWLGAFRLNADGTATAVIDEIPETEENTQNTPILSDEEKEKLEDALDNVFGDDMTKEEKLDVILNIVGVLSNSAGVGSDWDDLLFNLKTAASEEKVNGAIAVVILQMVVHIAYIIAKLAYKGYQAYKKKKNPDTLNKDVSDIKATENAQNKAINSVGETVTDIDKEVKHENDKINALADAGTAQNAALRTLIRGTGIDKELKHEALRDLNKSDDLYEIAKK